MAVHYPSDTTFSSMPVSLLISITGPGSLHDYPVWRFFQSDPLVLPQPAGALAGNSSVLLFQGI